MIDLRPRLLTPAPDGLTRSEPVSHTIKSLRGVAKKLRIPVEDVTFLTLHKQNHGFMSRSAQMDDEAPVNVSYTKAAEKLGVPVVVRGPVLVWRKQLPEWSHE